MLKKKRLIFAGNNFRRCEFPPENLSPQIFAYFFSAPCLDTTVVSKLLQSFRGNFFRGFHVFFVRKSAKINLSRKFANSQKCANSKPTKILNHKKVF